MRYACRLQKGLLVARDVPGQPRGLRQASARRTTQVILGNRRYLVGGDILTAIDGRPLNNWEQLNAYLDEEARVGQKVSLSILRGGNAEQLTATLVDTPQQLQ